MEWGNWVFDSKRLTLTHKVVKYEIDLEKIRSSADIIDWIFQSIGKRWADPETIFDLLQALEKLLKPQANYYPLKSGKKINGGKIARKNAKRYVGK